MRCVDCLPLIEEYFDGEAEERVAGQMRAHLSSCADCSAALDALSFEQEAYARYDRGLEVTPALWARVSAEIAREPAPESRVENRPFLSRVRDSFVGAFATLTARPALASSFALLLVGITAGSIWLTYVRRELPPAVAVNTPQGNGVQPSPAQRSENVGGQNMKATPVETPVEVELAATPREVARKDAAPPPRGTKPTHAGGESMSDEEFNRLVAASSTQPQSYPGTVNPNSPEAETRDEVLPAPASAEGGVPVVTASAQVLDPEEKEVARHVEQAQLLLRSIKNARAAEGETVNVAYERQLSRRLLGDNATLQLDAEARGDKETKQVLDRIEPYLLDIANMHDNASREEVRSIRERIDRKEIIAALQVY